MIVHETAIHQITVEFKLLHVPLRPSIMNRNQYHNGRCKRPQNTKCETIHKTRQSTLSIAKIVNKEQITKF